MDSINSVVRQDKCSGSLRPVGSCFSFPLRPFSEGHCSLMSTPVTRTSESAVTRAIFLFGVLLIGTTLMVFCGRRFGLRIMLTDSSAPAGIYRVEPLPTRQSLTDLKRGELVEVCLPVAIAERGLERGYLQPGRCPGVCSLIATSPSALRCRVRPTAKLGRSIGNPSCADY